MNKTIKHCVLCVGFLASSALYCVDPILISNASQVGGFITLAGAGNYQATEDLIYPVIIATDGVCLNLNRHKVSCDAALSPVVTINPYLTEVALFNGRLKTSGVTRVGTGLFVSQGDSNVSAHDLKIYNCAIGVECDGQLGSEIITSEILGVECVNTMTGFALKYTDDSVIKKCIAAQASSAGFSLLSCDVNLIVACQALATLGTQAVSGFVSNAGTNNLFMNCIAKQTKTTSVALGDVVSGFLLKGAEQKTKIIDCIVNDVAATNGYASAYGIDLLKPAILTSGVLNTVQTGDTTIVGLHSVALSPDGKFAAECWHRSSLNQNLKIAPVNTDGVFDYYIATLSLDYPCSVAWSPDGKYLAVGLSTGEVRVYTFDGSSLSTIFAAYSVGSNNIWGLAWSPNGKYLAFSRNFNGAARYCSVHILKFDGYALERTNYQDFDRAPVDPEIPVTISWHPDGTALVVANIDNVGAVSSTKEVLSILAVNESGYIVARYDTLCSGGIAEIQCATFSPNGRFIAVGGYMGGGNYGLMIFQFNGTTITSTTPSASVAIQVLVSTHPRSTAWSPDGRYIAVGTNGWVYLSTPLCPKVLMFELTSPSSLSLKGTSACIGPNPTSSSVDGDAIYALCWAPSGRWILAANTALASYSSISSYHSSLYAMTIGANNCLVDHCTVCDVQKNAACMGTGYAGVSGNIFTNNLSGNNAVAYTYGIPNVYDGKFELTRNSVQPFDNISCPTVL